MKGAAHRLFFAVHRLESAAGVLYEWKAVRGLRMNVSSPGWSHLKLFTYRMGRVVWVAEEETGMHVACGATVARARMNLNEVLAACGGRYQLGAAIRRALYNANPGPRPVVKLRKLT
jgi:hypothetical protein